MIDPKKVELVIELAKECEGGDPIDWGLLSVTEEQAYQMMASSVLEQIDGLPESEQLLVAQATMTKLLVENFVLNLKLNGAEKLLNNS